MWDIKVTPGKCLLLQKALYGLPKSGELWQKHLNNKLVNLSFHPTIDANSKYEILVYKISLIAFKISPTNLDFILKLLKQDFNIQELGTYNKIFFKNSFLL